MYSSAVRHRNQTKQNKWYQSVVTAYAYDSSDLLSTETHCIIRFVPIVYHFSFKMKNQINVDHTSVISLHLLMVL